MTLSSLGFPFGVEKRGAAVAAEGHAVIRQQIEQVLFTLPGERVGRPTFGIGVQRYVFATMDAATRASVEYTIARNLAQAMPDVIGVDAVRVSTVENELFIDILFTLRASGEELHMVARTPLGDAP